MNLGRFNELPAGARVGIIAGAAVVFLVIVYFAVFNPILNKTSEYEQKTKNERSKIVRAKELISHLPEKRILLVKMREEAQVLMLKVPNIYNIPTLLEQLASTAQRASINQIPLKQLDSYPNTLPGSDLTFYVVPISIRNLECRFKDLVRFLEGFGHLDRLVNIKRLECRRLDIEEQMGEIDVPGIKVNLEIETYQLEAIAAPLLESGARDRSAGF
ncbi:type 4a pilus biogenesis protein PilO [bacterium]|nr:type 4a pilus biogenesis protein PilO [bacterium]